MDNFCGGKLWDLEITWNTTSPDFTPCFETTVLIWVPCAFFWLFSLVDIFQGVDSGAKNVPKSPLSVLKYGFTILLIVGQLLVLLGALLLSDLKERFYPADYLATVVKIASYTLYCALLYYSRQKGIRSSGIQSLFWLFHALCEAVRFRSIIVAWQNEKDLDEIIFTVEVIAFPCIVGMFLLNCWADARSEFERESNYSEKPCPEKGASFFSQILYHWFNGMAWRGYKSPLKVTELWDLNSEDKSNYIVPAFEKSWKEENIKRRAREIKKSESGAAYSKVNGDVDFSKKERPEAPRELVSVMPVLFSCFGTYFLFGSAMRLVPDLMAFISPQILNLIIGYTAGEEPVWKGLFYAIILFVTALITTVLNAQHNQRMYLVGMKIRTALVSAIYRKALLISNSAKRTSTVGEIVNLMSVDIQKIMDLVPFINIVWSSPLTIGVSLYFLWQIVGPASMAGLVSMILLIPLHGVFVSKTKKYQFMQMKKKDLRIKMMNEILNGIKVLKLYAWEESFENQVMKIRREEIAILKKAAYLSCASGFLWASAPFMVAFSTFGTYVLLDENNVLDAQVAFVSLSLFNLMSVPLMFLPMIMVFLVQASVSITRINKFMNSDEIDPDAVTHDKNEADAIVVENANFEWVPDALVLRNINLRITEGSFVAIVGTVGSGKSSLLSAILGEVDKISGRVNTKGSIAYVPQQAWVQNATLRDNILFGRGFDPIKYDKVVENCALTQDMEILPAGDKTEIGEKGINLSGGQKQRVSLARAAYNNADVYLLDDPLSAVDAHVGKHIFEKVLGPKGLLRKKTRVLVTHGIAYLPIVDNIIVMKDGEISEIGTYKELLERKKAFADFLNQYIKTEGLSELEDTQLIQDLQEVIADKDLLRRVSETSNKESDASPKKRSLGRQESVESPLKQLQPIKPKSISNGKEKLIEVEKSETASVKIGVYFDYFRAAGWYISLATIFWVFVLQLTSVGSNLWLSEWTNQEPTTNGTQDSSSTYFYLGIYGAFGAAKGISIVFAWFFLAIGTLRAASNLHYKMLWQILRAPMLFFETTPVGRIVNRFAKDVDVCDTVLPFNLRMLLNSFFTVLATLSIISYTTPLFLTVVIPVGFFYYLVQRFYVATSRQLKRLESVTRSPIYSHFGETITGASTIRAYSEQERFIRESEAIVDHNQSCYFPAVVANRWLSIRLETIGSLIIFFAALFAVLGRGSLSPGLVGLSVSYALQITFSLGMLVRWTSEVETNIVAVERLKEYAETTQEAPWKVEDRKPNADWPDKGVLEFNNYETRYRPGLDLVLRNVTCKINAGEKVGIVGRTGAGKSSLTLALFRIIEPSGGNITIDGKDITRLGLHDIRGRLTIIPQDPVLFSGTLRINLDPFEQYSDETIYKALELAHLKAFVKTLQAGLQHEISEGGENLSVGQRQLVCLARAVLRKTKILVLDEATAAVDLETDDLIQETIRQEFKDSTVVTIAHRLNTIMDSDRVMVLDNGEIKEFDSPSDLLKNKNSIFSSMAKDAGIT